MLSDNERKFPMFSFFGALFGGKRVRHSSGGSIFRRKGGYKGGTYRR